MQFVYQPAGAKAKVWDFDTRRLMSPEAEAIERHTEMTFGEWEDAIARDSILAIHGLLFVLLRRDNASLKWDQVQFSMSEVRFEFDATEKAAVRAGLRVKAAQGQLDPDGLAYLATLNDDPDLPADEPAEGEEPEAPKAASRRGSAAAKS